MIFICENKIVKKASNSFEIDQTVKMIKINKKYVKEADSFFQCQIKSALRRISSNEISSWENARSTVTPPRGGATGMRRLPRDSSQG